MITYYGYSAEIDLSSGMPSVPVIQNSTMGTIQVVVFNNNRDANFIDCRLYDEFGNLVWENGKRYEPRESSSDYINLKPGIYTMEADAYTAVRSFTSTFEFINEGLFVLDFDNYLWDSGSGYMEFNAESN